MDRSELNDQLNRWNQRAKAAQAAAAQAYARLLKIAESDSGGEALSVARFVASTYDGNAYPFDLFELRVVDVEVSDDMLVCLDALRWGKADLYRLVPEAAKRIQAIIADWKITPLRD